MAEETSTWAIVSEDVTEQKEIEPRISIRRKFKRKVLNQRCYIKHPFKFSRDFSKIFLCQ